MSRSQPGRQLPVLGLDQRLSQPGLNLDGLRPNLIGQVNGALGIFPGQFKLLLTQRVVGQYGVGMGNAVLIIQLLKNVQGQKQFSLRLRKIPYA